MSFIFNWGHALEKTTKKKTVKGSSQDSLWELLLKIHILPQSNIYFGRMETKLVSQLSDLSQLLVI